LLHAPAMHMKAANLSRLPTNDDAAVGVSTMAGSTAQVHVLIGDGDEMSRRTREAQLRRAGFRVSVARTGFETIVKATCHMPDVILLDDCLGDIDAGETGRLISTCPATSHIQVVRLSSGRTLLPRRVLTIVRQAAL
jgi:PleD family two-component response regulator